MKVETVHSAPIRIRHSARSSLNDTRRSRPTNADLPLGTVDKFNTFIVPMVYDTMGVLLPWVSLSDDEIVNMWNAVFGDSEHRIDVGDNESNLFRVVKSLVRPFV